MVDYLAKYREAARRIRDRGDMRTPVCWEFVCHVRSDHHLETPRMQDIVMAQMDIGPIAEKHNHLLQSKPRQWSVVLFECTKFDWHAGIILPGLRQFIHCRRKHGIEITDINDRFWSKRCRGYYDNR